MFHKIWISSDSAYQSPDLTVHRGHPNPAMSGAARRGYAHGLSDCLVMGEAPPLVFQGPQGLLCDTICSLFCGGRNGNVDIERGLQLDAGSKVCQDDLDGLSNITDCPVVSPEETRLSAKFVG